MKTLIALFSNEWNRFIPGLGDDTASAAYRARLWNHLLNPLENIEIALFQPTLLETQDFYPTEYRRFIQVGQTLEERIHNLFELCAEKQYSRVLFVDTFGANTSTQKIQNMIRALEENDLVFLPTDQGSILAAGMNLKLFPNWTVFDFEAPESIVEALSEAIRLKATYKLMDAYNIRLATSRFVDELALQTGKSNS